MKSPVYFATLRACSEHESTTAKVQRLFDKAGFADLIAPHNKTAIKRDCVTCHQDFHLGRLSQSCDKCHLPAGWKVTRPFEIHRTTRLPLTGMHVLADCSQCHVRASEQRFTDAPADCYACHQKDVQRPGIFPHTATAAEVFARMSAADRAAGRWVLVSTAHPAKFREIVEPLTGAAIEIPESLAKLFSRPVSCEDLEPNLASLAGALATN